MDHELVEWRDGRVAVSIGVRSLRPFDYKSLRSKVAEKMDRDAERANTLHPHDSFPIGTV